MAAVEQAVGAALEEVEEDLVDVARVEEGLVVVVGLVEVVEEAEEEAEELAAHGY